MRNLKLMLCAVVIVGAAALGGFISPADAAIAGGCLGMLDAVTIGANFSPRAYAGDEAGNGRTQPPQAMFVSHRFFATADGQLNHEVDGIQRATVPPEGFDAYVLHWPDAGYVVSQLRAAGEARQRAAAEARTVLEAELRSKLTAEITAQVVAQLRAEAAAAKPSAT